MICSNCGTQNDAGLKFCIECATPLAAGCPNCGTVNAPSAKFCGECATPLQGRAEGAPGVRRGEPTLDAARDHAPVAERRVVSVLFADLVGFTPFAEERDAEDVRETLSRYFDLASDVIGRYGGTVEKFIGDAVMAVWGAPVAREDDAERAVRAALELVDAVKALGPGIQARSGVLTGEAAVTIGATNQGMVAGDLVNTAARLQSVAPPGSVLVGEATERAASKAIVFEEAGDQLLKGKTAPVPAWRAARVVAERGGRNRSDALEAPFVGRDEELRLLKDLFHTTARERRIRLMSVIGPAGIGKSRLAWEFLKYIDGLVEDIWWHDGRSPAYGDGITFWALGEMVRARAKLLEGDDDATTREKIGAIVAEHVLDPEERHWIEQALLALLGVEGGVPADQLFGAWRTFFERLAASGPVVLVFEDFHFADPGLIDFVDHLMDWSKGSPIYVVTLSRPELLERRSGWGAGKRNFVSLSLEPLGDSAMRELLGGLVPGLPPQAVRAIVTRAGGIPLYAVETVRMLLAEGRLREESGVYVPVGDLTALAVPETLTALIASRLDALSAQDRAVLQDAAVLGQSFTVAGLAAVSGREADELETTLQELVRRELLVRELDPRSPEQGQLAFVQALIREVAYNMLAKKDRKDRHLAAARFFESLGSDELAGALAAQYLAAHANASAGAEGDALAGQARVSLRAAAERAMQLGSLQQAITFLDQAREVTTDEEETADLLERAGMAAHDGGQLEIAEARLRQALELRARAGDDQAIARLTAEIGQALISGLRYDAGIALLEPAVAGLPADEAAIGEGGVRLLAQLSRGHFLAGHQQQAIELADRALAVGERLDLVSVVSDLLITRGTSLGIIGRAYEGLGAIKAGVELAQDRGLTATALRGLTNLSAVQGSLDPRASYDTAREVVALARRLGQGGAIGIALGNAAGNAFLLGDWDWAIGELSEAIEEETEELNRNYHRWNLAPIRAARGDDVGHELVELVRWAEGMEETGARNAIHGLKGEVAFGAGRLTEAIDEMLASAVEDPSNSSWAAYTAGVASLVERDVDHAQSALTILEDLRLHGRLPDADRGLLQAGIAGLEGRVDEARQGFQQAQAGYRDLGVMWRSALTGLVMVSVLGPDDPMARAASEDASDTFARLGARPMLERLAALIAGEAPARLPERVPSGPRAETLAEA